MQRGKNYTESVRCGLPLILSKVQTWKIVLHNLNYLFIINLITIFNTWKYSDKSLVCNYYNVQIYYLTRLTRHTYSLSLHMPQTTWLHPSISALSCHHYLPPALPKARRPRYFFQIPFPGVRESLSFSVVLQCLLHYLLATRCSYFTGKRRQTCTTWRQRLLYLDSRDFTHCSNRAARQAVTQQDVCQH